LELGVGSGLLTEPLLDLCPDLKLTGIDHTASMLERAQRRVGHRCSLHHRDILTLDLDDRFEAIFANGGVWYFVDEGDHFELYSHLISDDDNQQGLRKVWDHLAEGGLFILSAQRPHHALQMPLEDGTLYQQEVRREGPLLHKRYLRSRGETLLGEQHIRFRILGPMPCAAWMAPAGFRWVGLDATRHFLVFERIT